MRVEARRYWGESDDSTTQDAMAKQVLADEQLKGIICCWILVCLALVGGSAPVLTLLIFLAFGALHSFSDRMPLAAHRLRAW